VRDRASFWSEVTIPPGYDYLSFDREQRKKTRLSCVESLMGTFTLRADFKNGPPHQSGDNANQ
jgi:hypothetical protein